MAPIVMSKLHLLSIGILVSFVAAAGSESCSTGEQAGKTGMRSLLQTVAGGTGTDKELVVKQTQDQLPGETPSAIDGIIPLTRRLTGLEEKVVALEHKGDNKAAALQSHVDALNSRLSALQSAVHGKASAMLQDSSSQPAALMQQSKPGVLHKKPKRPLTALTTHHRRQDPVADEQAGEESAEGAEAGVAETAGEGEAPGVVPVVGNAPVGAESTGAETEPIATRLTALEERVTALQGKGDNTLTNLKTEVDTIRSKLETLTKSVIGDSLSYYGSMIQTAEEDTHSRQDPSLLDADASATEPSLTKRIAILEMKVVSLGHRGDSRRTNLDTELDALASKLSNLERMLMGSSH